MATNHADVVVVGAGAAGACSSLALARRGFRVICLEQGGWVDPDESFRGDTPEWELHSAKHLAFSPNVRKGPADYPVQDADSDAAMFMYNAVGGSTILFNAVFPRMTPSDFRMRTLDGVGEDWPLSYNELRPWYQEAERQFGVSGLAGDPAYPDEAQDFPLPPLPLGYHGERMAAAQNELGWHWWPQANAIPSRSYRGLNPCGQRGTCSTGCPERAKASVDLSHWPEALRLGVDLRTGSRVARLVTGPLGQVTGAEYLDADGAMHLATADVFVLATNAVGTPRLLLMSEGPGHRGGLANGSGLVGRRLMVHPSARMLGFFEESFESWQGQFGGSITSMQFYETQPDADHVRGAKWTLTPGGGPLGNVSRLIAQGYRATELDRAFRDQFGHGASWSIMAEDLPELGNRVDLDPQLVDDFGLPAPRVRYQVSDNSQRILEANLERARQSFEVAGALHTEAERKPKMPGWHAMGTAVMGADPATSVVDSFGRAHEVPNLYIADASTFVTAGAVNPTNTLAALALRQAEHIASGRADMRVSA